MTTVLESIRRSVFAEVARAMTLVADIWERDGSDPCRVRITREYAEAYAKYSEGSGEPTGSQYKDRALTAEMELAELKSGRTLTSEEASRLLSRGARDIYNERMRQQIVLGYTKYHDEQHSFTDLAAAASVFLRTARGIIDTEARWGWPFSGRYKAPGSPREALVKAGAMCAAAIDRIDQLENKE